MFSAPLKTFCGAVVLHVQRAAYCVPFRFACAGNSESGMVHSIRFTAFATSGDALAGFRYSASSGGGLGLLVSRRPICFSSVCQYFKERLYFVVGSGATRKNFPRLGHNILNKMASSRIFKALTDNCALSIVLSTSNVRSDLVKPACLRRFAGNSIK